MRKNNLVLAVGTLIVIGAALAIKSFPAALSSASSPQSSLARVDARVPTKEIVPAPAIDRNAERFIGTGDGSAGSWVRP